MTKHPFKIYIVDNDIGGGEGNGNILATFTSKSDANDYAHRFDAFVHEFTVDEYDMNTWPEYPARCFGIHARYDLNGNTSIVVFEFNGPPDKCRNEWTVDALDPIAWHIQTWAKSREDTKRIGREWLESKREYVENLLERIRSNVALEKK